MTEKEEDIKNRFIFNILSHIILKELIKDTVDKLNKNKKKKKKKKKKINYKDFK